MNFLAHPWWTVYGGLTLAFLALMVHDIGHNRERTPDERVPVGGYIAWAVFSFVWPVVIALILAVIIVD